VVGLEYAIREYLVGPYAKSVRESMDVVFVYVIERVLWALRAFLAVAVDEIVRESEGTAEAEA